MALCLLALCFGAFLNSDVPHNIFIMMAFYFAITSVQRNNLPYST